jgi:hypothetical protein
MVEALSSSETSVLVRATRRNILEDGILHAFCFSLFRLLLLLLLVVVHYCDLPLRVRWSCSTLLLYPQPLTWTLCLSYQWLPRADVCEMTPASQSCSCSYLIWQFISKPAEHKKAAGEQRVQEQSLWNVRVISPTLSKEVLMSFRLWSEFSDSLSPIMIYSCHLYNVLELFRCGIKITDQWEWSSGASHKRSCKIWGFHGGYYEECRLLGYKIQVPTSQETHYISVTEPSQLMLCKIWSFHGSDYEECRLLTSYAAWLL